MQNEFTEKFHEFYQNINKPIGAITDLNVKTISRWSKNTDLLNDFVNAKKPEDIIEANIKLATTAGSEAIKYAQEFSKICTETAWESSSNFVSSIQKTVKSNGKSKE